MIRSILVIMIVSLLPHCAAAQEVKLTATASPNVMRVGEQFNLIFTSDQEVSELELPAADAVEILGGPSQGHSQSVYAVNGKVTTSSTYQYTYFLRALKEGKFTIPAASAKIKNKACKSNPVNIEVIASRNQPAKSNPAASEGGQKQNGSIVDNDVLVSLLLDKKEVYLGEQIIATVKIYTKVNLSGVDNSFKGPDFTGFFTEALEVPPLRNLQREAVNGEIYYTGVLRKMLIIPQKSGELIIQPFDLDVAVHQETRRRIADSFFDNFDIPDVQEIPVKLRSKALHLQVKPLPGGAPSSYTGAVGSFSFSSALNKTTTKTNDPLTLKLTISGRGNIKLINELNLNVPADMEKYDPVINTHQDNSLSGTKTFEYLLVPKIAGSFTIPPVEFTYFDPVSSQYKTLKSQAFTLQVERGQGDSLISVMPGVAKEDIKMINRDIRFIKNKPVHLLSRKSFWADSPWYYLIYALLIAVFFLLITIHRKLVQKKADIAGLRLRKADRYAQKRLKKSAGLLKQGESNLFYEELLGAIWGYLSDKLNIPLSILSQETAKSSLSARSVDENTILALFGIISECEMARYGQVSENQGMEKLYQDALDVITGLQQKLK
jgi:hypothetical protein